MASNTRKHQRRSIRLKDYDYAQVGAYFVTIVTHGRRCLFGQIVEGTMRANELGVIVQDEWLKSPAIRREVELDVFVVMPNHVHGIVNIIGTDVGATGRSPLRPGPPKRSVGAFVAGFKSAVTKSVNEFRNTPGTPIWQRNYFEHVIRNETELGRIREYIVNNPLKWETDRENPLRIEIVGAGLKPGPTQEPWAV